MYDPNDPSSVAFSFAINRGVATPLAQVDLNRYAGPVICRR
jgi:hypothetical protein